jgi:Fe-S-cluster containining protein
MKDFEFYKTIRLFKNKKADKIFSKLHNIYKTIPETMGCMDNISIGEACNGWCCRIQTPQLFYSEFFLIWQYISKNWNDDEICDLLEKCMINAVNELPSKGCVYFDDKTSQCKVHKKRPYNCRIYGITPDEEFNPRYEKLKEEYKTILGSVIKPQCNLVSTTDGEKVTVEDINKWWSKIVEVERELGIPRDMINDEMGGSYRSQHDHVLLYNMPENVLNSLAGIKMYESFEEKLKAIKEIISCIRNHFKENSKNAKNEES